MKSNVLHGNDKMGDVKQMDLIRKEKSLDGIKGLAACIVAFAWHYQHFGVGGGNSPFYKFIPLAFDYGWLMVELFFMLSGFGMMMGYKAKIQSHEMQFENFFL